MNELVFLKNSQALTTSLKVAEVFEKRHDHVVRDIRALISQIKEVPKIGEYKRDAMFCEKSYKAEGSLRSYPYYEMNFNGFTLLTMGFTGEKALKFKLDYIDAFDAMKNKLIELLAERKSAEYLEVRNATKVGYKKLAETIHQVLVPLAREQGSDTEEKFFHINYARSINKRLGIKSKSRDKLPVGKLYEVEKMQSMAEVSIKGLAAKGEDIHQIYRSTDQTLENYAQISLLNQRFLN